MGHEVMKIGNEYAAIGRQIWWWRFNQVQESGFTPSEGLKLIGGDRLQFNKAEMVQIDPYTGRPQVTHARIYRNPLPENNETGAVWLGDPVSIDYEIIDQNMAVRAVEQAIRDETGNPLLLEGMGFLRNGSIMWMIAKMPSNRVKTVGGGTLDMDHWIMYANPFDPNSAAKVYLTTSMVVCKNTMDLAIKNAARTITVAHTPGAYDRLVDALGEAYNNSVLGAKEATETVQKLLNIPLEKRQLIDVLKQVFKDPKGANKTRKCKISLARREDNAWYNQQAQQAKREEVMRLWEEGFEGSHIPGIEGTAMAGYMCLTEALTHEIKATSADAYGYEMLYGDRGRAIRTGRDLLLAVR